MVSRKRRLQSLRRQLIQNLFKVLGDLNKKLDQGTALGPNGMFFILAAPLAIEQLTVDKAFGEVEIDVLKETFEALVDFPVSF